nr:unnamed protein product [Gossypium raimondii]
MIAKSREEREHVGSLRKLFERLRKFQLKLNPAKCTFGATSGKLLGFIVSERGIEVDPDKIKAIQELPPPRTQKEVRGFLGRLNYIARFIAQLTNQCDPIFRLLRKRNLGEWNEECQVAFDKIKQYLSNPPVLVPPTPEKPLILYLTVFENSMGCVLGQHDESGKREKAIYYLSKKFTEYEAKYPSIEKFCWRMARWQILLTEYDIVYVSQKSIKGSAIADFLASRTTEEYEPLIFEFPDEDLMCISEKEGESSKGKSWKMSFDGASNALGHGIGAVLVSPEGDHYPLTTRLNFFCTNNIAEYEACIMGLRAAIKRKIKILEVHEDSALVIYQIRGDWEVRDPKLVKYHDLVAELIKEFYKVTFNYFPQEENQLADALATLASMFKVNRETEIMPIQMSIYETPAHCFSIEEESDGRPWFHDILEYIKNQRYPEQVNENDKRTIRRMAFGFVLDGDILYKRGKDQVLLRCVDAVEARKILEEVHEGICGTHASGFTMARQIMRLGYYWLTVERDCIGYARKCHKYNALNLNNKMMKKVCEQFQIKHHNSSPYRPKMNGAVEAANKNIKRIIGKMTETYKDWHDKLPFALYAYCTSVRTSTGATPFSLVYGIEAVLPIEVEIPSLRVLMETRLEESEWVRVRYDQLKLIEGKRLKAICHGQMYQKRMITAHDKKVRPREFREGELVLRKILPIQKDFRGKWSPNWEGPYVVKRAFSGGALILTEMDGKELPNPVNLDAVKKYYA